MYLLKSYLHSMYKIYVYANNKYQIAYEQLEQTLKVVEKISKQKQDSFNAGKSQVNEENEAKKQIDLDDPTFKLKNKIEVDFACFP